MPQHIWSQWVTQRSNALSLEPGVFTRSDPKAIAQSLLRSAQHSTRRKSASSYRSAMSMLSFYINRAGRNLSAERRTLLEDAKIELRQIADKGL